MSIRVNVDPTNPGQFFACCGLLELADRLWPGAEGWFTNSLFQIECPGTLDYLLAVLVMDPPEEMTRLDNGLEVKPLIAPLRFSFDGGATTSITLDAWLTIKTDKGKVITAASPPWNFWSGQQTSKRIWSALRLALADQLKKNGPAGVGLFGSRVLLKGRFGFDPGAAWSAIDVGFSPNEQGIDVASSPVVELLAAVGIQRFRPQLSDDRASFLYATWGQPLGPGAASAATAGMARVGPSARFRGHVVSRGSYAALGHSTQLRGDADE